ncbi:MAG: hypothetical protein WC538_08185 [Thermoanaerobaculia bacterium]
MLVVMDAPAGEREVGEVIRAIQASGLSVRAIAGAQHAPAPRV